VLQIDTRYLGEPDFTACYILHRGGEAAVIETNTNHAVPAVLDGLSAHGLHPEQVRYVILTHVHLDHAGGAGRLMRALPNAVLLVHPRGRRHMADPGRLIASVKQVYGEEKYLALYGDIQPVEPSRIRDIEDGAAFDLDARPLRFLHTPGHAKHHAVVFDEHSGALFSGDAFGIAYPRYRRDGFRFIFPSTSPVQFDPDDSLASFQKIVDLRPARILLTHFGELTDVAQAYGQLGDLIGYSMERAEKRYAQVYRGEALERFLEEDLWSYYEGMLERGLDLRLDETEREFLNLDAHLNAMGLAFYIQRARE